MKHNVSLSHRHKWSTMSLYKVAAVLSGVLSFMQRSSRDEGISLDPNIYPTTLIFFPSCEFDPFDMSNQRPSCYGTEEQRRKYRCLTIVI